MKKRTIALLCAAMMVVGIAAGGTLAWLVSKPDSVTNTFTTSDVDITLTEPEGEKNDYKFQMVPGKTITKDPKVTVTADSLDSYIFVEITKSDNYDQFLDSYAVATGWTGGTGTGGGTDWTGGTGGGTGTDTGGGTGTGGDGTGSGSGTDTGGGTGTGDGSGTGDGTAPVG